MPRDEDGSVYRPLDVNAREIRILVRRSPGPLMFTFEYASLKAGGVKEYDAISWCWGDPTPRRYIVVDGKRISISENAFEVITDLCIAQKKYRIWIDAVCINQPDLAERSQQVAMMNLIYENARSTLVWLGKDDGITSQGVDALQEMLDWRQDQHARDGHKRCGLACRATSKHPFPPQVDWPAIMTIFASTWFGRFWIIQEVAFSRHTDLFRGRERLRWNMLAEAAHYMVLNQVQNFTTDQLGVQGVKNATMIGKIRERGGVVVELLHDNQNFEATDPKDRVFALYGLLGRDLATAKAPLDGQTIKVLRDACVPNYSKSVVQVYAEMTKAALKCNLKRTNLLYDCGRFVPRFNRNPCLEVFPSWVPRYDYIQDLRRGSYKHATTAQNATAGAEDVKIDFETNERTLRVAGLIIDTIDQVIEPADVDDSSSQPLGLTREKLFGTLSAFLTLLKSSKPHSSDSELSSMLMAILTAGHSMTSDSNDHYQYWNRDFCAFVDKLWPYPKPPYQLDDQLDDRIPIAAQATHDHDNASGEDSDGDDSLSSDSSAASGDRSRSDSSESSEMDEDSAGRASPSAQHEDMDNAERFLAHVREHCINRTLFVSKAGRPGSGARNVQKGDCVCLFFGFPLPFVLRQVGDEFLLIGDAFVDGIMQGECITELATHEGIAASERWFDII